MIFSTNRQRAYPGFQKIFVLIDTDGSRRGAERKRLGSLIKLGLFHLRYFENGPLKPGYSAQSARKKERNLFPPPPLLHLRRKNPPLFLLSFARSTISNVKIEGL